MSPSALWDRLPFTARVLVTASIALVVAALAMVGVSARQEAAEVRDDLAAVLAQELETLPATLAEVVVIGDFATLQQTLDHFVTRPLIVSVSFRDNSGAILDSHDRTRHDSAPEWFIDAFGYQSISGETMIAVGGRNYGILTLTLSPQLPAYRAWRHLINHLAILLLAVAADFVGIWLVLHFGLRPLQQLERAADDIAAGHLDMQLAVRGSPELRRLFDRFNRMAAALSEAREALHDESERLLVTLESIGDGVIATDTKGRVQFLNPVAEDLTGWALEEALGRSILEVFVIVNETTRETTECPVTRCLREGRIVGLANHTLLIARDGRERPIADSAAPIRGADGRIHGAVLVFRDQSEERARIERLRLTASVFQHSLNAVMITDAQKRIVEVNPAFTQITGYARDEALGHTPRLLASGRHDAAFYAAMWAQIQAQGHWRGEIWNRRKDGREYPEELTIIALRDEAGAVSHYVGIFRDLTQLKAQEDQLKHLAYHDALTGLPNRALLADRMQVALAQAQRSGERLAVCYLDLDGFKPVNDRLGHAVGDRLLQEVAQRLQQAVRGGDTVARLGGDEFVLLLNHATDLQQCDLILRRVLQAIARPALLDGETLSVSASIGVTLFPDDAADADTLLRHADQALYAAKEMGRNRYQLFDVHNAFASRERRSTLTRLEEAVGKGEFRLYYQPKVDMRAGRVVALEALIRWQHPQRGLVPPGEFLPRLAGSELEQRVGEWVIRTALAQMTAWRAAGLDLLVSVNISPHHLARPHFPARLGELLRLYAEVPPERLELEVLESAALEDLEEMLPLMEACRSLGVQFALDDFGTGYSSLVYLRRLPVAMLKIDQSFVRDMLTNPEDQAIVAGIIGLSKAFHIGVVAEGVETAAQGRALLRLGCDLLQGYGIARPMPADEVPAWVAQWRPDAAWMESGG